MSRPHRSYRYRKYWSALIEAHGYMCFYCQIRVATSIDHIIPISYDEMDDIDNLVPACAICNSIAGNKVFSNVWQKRQYILDKIGKKYKRIAECTECLLLYQYRVDSPSLFLCPICYDSEYGTSYSVRESWAKWLGLLEDAGIVPEAHNKLREESKSSRKHKMRLLSEFYKIEFAVEQLAIPRY